MTRKLASKLAEVLITQCCIEGIRGPSGAFRFRNSEAALQEAITQLLLRTVSEIETAEALAEMKA